MGAPSRSWCDDRPIVGRDEEIAALRRAIDAARGGRGAVVVVEGAPGSGRTRLVTEAAAEARSRDFRVVWLPGRADVASSVVAAVLDDAARGRPVLIVDDHEPSASFSSLGIDPSRLPVLALVTKTTRPLPAGEVAGHAEVEGQVVRLRLRPLRPGTVMALAARMGTLASIPILERLHAATGGNALLVVETLAVLGRPDADGESEPWPLSEDAMRWMRARLDAVGRADRDALEAASVLGQECDVALVERMIGAGADPSAARAALAASPFVALRDGGARTRFDPPLVRALVYASLTADQRATWHARAAVALATTGTSMRAVAAHRALAAAATGDARACEHHVRRLVDARLVPDVPMSPAGWPYFVREGEHWAIGFGDRTIRLTDRTGLLYLARLLARPGVEFEALALGERQRVRNGDDDAPGEPMLAAERARVRVTRRIRDGIERIARAHPELGAHLEQTIRTGARCTYVVDAATGPRWEVRWTG